MTAKASRTNMPLENVLTGWSMNSPMSAKATISPSRRSISLRGTPRIAPLTNTFSRPVHSGLNPLPSSRSAPTRPFTVTAPAAG